MVERAPGRQFGRCARDYFSRLASGQLMLLTLYAKSATDNLTGSQLKEIRRVLES